MQKSAGAIIVYDKKILMLLRDDNPKIPDPDCWQLIGGGCEKNEAPMETLTREIKEETNIDIKKGSAKEIGKIVIPNKKEFFLYWVRLDRNQIKNLMLGNEGQKLEFISMNNITFLKLGSNLLEYFKRHQKGLEILVEKDILSKESLGFNKDGIYYI